MKKKVIEINNITPSLPKEGKKVRFITKVIYDLENRSSIIKKQKKYIEELKDNLFRDSLTNCYTRKWLKEKYINGDIKFNKSGFMILIDLDNFKIINDTYGHNVGDDALRFISHQLMMVELSQSKQRKVVRLGGDEFLLILNESEKELGETLQEVESSIYNLKQKIENKRFSTEDGYAIKLIFSYGVAEFKKNQEYKYVLEQADKKMYQNKKRNKKIG